MLKISTETKLPVSGFRFLACLALNLLNLQEILQAIFFVQIIAEGRNKFIGEINYASYQQLTAVWGT